MKFTLDTNAVIAILENEADMHRFLRKHSPSDFALSVVVLHELYYRAYKSRRRQQNIDRIEALAFDMLDFSRDDARYAGELRATLAERGEPIGPYDSLIAGQALSRGLRVVTKNAREFSRVPALRTEAW